MLIGQQNCFCVFMKIWTRIFLVFDYSIETSSNIDDAMLANIINKKNCFIVLFCKVRMKWITIGFVFFLSQCVCVYRTANRLQRRRFHFQFDEVFVSFCIRCEFFENLKQDVTLLSWILCYFRTFIELNQLNQFKSQTHHNLQKKNRWFLNQN